MGCPNGGDPSFRTVGSSRFAPKPPMDHTNPFTVYSQLCYRRLSQTAEKKPSNPVEKARADPLFV
jgi:hypothetical protein